MIHCYQEETLSRTQFTYLLLALKLATILVLFIYFWVGWWVGGLL